MPVGPGTTGQGGGGTAAAGQASAAAAAAAGPGPGTGPGGSGPPSAANAGGGTGGHGSFGTYGSRGDEGRSSGRGPANPAAAAAMMSDLGRSVTQTGDPDSPYGEMSPQQQAQIGAMLGRSQDRSVIGGFTDILGALSGPVGTGMSLAGLLGVPSVSDTDPVTEAVAANYGKGTFSGLFGNYSDDPGIQAATESYFAGRTPSGLPPEGPGDYVLRNGLMVPRDEADPAKPGDPDYGIYTPDWRPT